MNGRSSAQVLERSLEGFRGQLTVADAAARTGLPMREAAEGLAGVAAEYSGHLAVTSKGELVYDFRRGLVRTGQLGLMRRFARGVAKAVFGVARLVVRAWISVALIGYAVVFAGVLIAIAAKSDNDGVGDVFGVLLQVIFESIYWTIHPFSPVYLAREPGWVQRRKGRRSVTAEVPFYERVNRFVFGPPPAVLDPLLDAKRAVNEIRRQQGRVAPADIMRVTGGSREAAERTLLRLVADHEGDIKVSDEGAIVYEFAGLRTTADAERATAPGDDTSIWKRLAESPPLTGNSGAFNALFVVVNGFNLVASGVALSMDLTIERLIAMIARSAVEDPPPLPPADGVPLALGLVPFLFSAALFALPLLRRLGRARAKARVAHDNHVRLLLKHLLAGREEERRFHFAPAELASALALDGRSASEADIERAVRTLGGSVDLAKDGTLVYTFDDLAREHAAVRASRALASPDEAAPGAVLLSSADEGHGLRPDPDDAAPAPPADGTSALRPQRE